MYLSMSENPQECSRVKRVPLDGEDVTRLCFALDTDDGWVGVYATDGDGHLIFDQDVIGLGRVRTEYRYGRKIQVELRRESR